jgi:hypothetical protein
MKPKAQIRVGDNNVGEEIHSGNSAVASINVVSEQSEKSSNNNIHINNLVGEKKMEENKNITHQNVNGVASIQSSSGTSSDVNNNNNNNNPNNHVNFANAVFNKHFVSVQQSNNNHNDSTLPDVSVNSVNLSSSGGETSLSDDLSSMAIIDDKSVLASLKAKFEARKYYVSKATLGAAKLKPLLINV